MIALVPRWIMTKEIETYIGQYCHTCYNVWDSKARSERCPRCDSDNTVNCYRERMNDEKESKSNARDGGRNRDLVGKFLRD